MDETTKALLLSALEDARDAADDALTDVAIDFDPGHAISKIDLALARIRSLRSFSK